MIGNNKIQETNRVEQDDTNELRSRRNFVKKVTKISGAFAAAAFFFKDFGRIAFAAQRRGTDCKLDPVKLELRFDEKKCAGCKLCEVVCSEVHEGYASTVTHRNRVVLRPLLEFVGLSGLTANAPGYPQTLSPTIFAEFSENHFCRQCISPECMDACPENAIYVDQRTGARVVDPKKCTGVGECVDACQFDMIHINPETDIAVKCDLCGGDPQCAAWCPTGAITVKKL